MPWDDGVASPVELGRGIKYGKLEDSEIGKLYEKLCFEDKVDDGEPFGYSVYFDVDQSASGTGLEFESPYTIYMRLCNMATICSDHSVGMVRVIASSDGYKTASFTNQLFWYPFQDEQVGWFSKNKKEIKYLHTLKRYLDNEDKLFRKWQYTSRIANALIYFFYAWRSYHVEPACINLSIVLESLFGPEGSNEISHQIAFNVSRFIGKNNEDRKKVYKEIKRFYSVRSKIVHGVVPKEDAVLKSLEYMFPLISLILRKIMTNNELFNGFNSKRKLLIEKWLFD